MEGVLLSRVDDSNLNNRQISGIYRLDCELSIKRTHRCSDANWIACYVHVYWASQ